MYHAIIGKRPEKVELHFSLEAILIYISVEFFFTKICIYQFFVVPLHSE